MALASPIYNGPLERECAFSTSSTLVGSWSTTSSNCPAMVSVNDMSCLLNNSLAYRIRKIRRICNAWALDGLTRGLNLDSEWTHAKLPCSLLWGVFPSDSVFSGDAFCSGRRIVRYPRAATSPRDETSHLDRHRLQNYATYLVDDCTKLMVR